jgi:hypothetical protein
VIITTEAPMIPVVAAMMVPMIVTTSASPPGTLASSRLRQRSSAPATPDRSSIVPMKMNIGTATRIRFSAMPPQIRGTSETERYANAIRPPAALLSQIRSVAMR